MKLSLTISIIGIVALFFILEAIEPKHVSISEINNEMIGQHVTVKGVANNVYNNEGTLFLSLTDGNQNIKVIMFQSSSEVNENDTIEVIGKLALYKNELEIIASGIKKL